MFCINKTKRLVVKSPISVKKLNETLFQTKALMQAKGHKFSGTVGLEEQTAEAFGATLLAACWQNGFSQQTQKRSSAAPRANANHFL